MKKILSFLGVLILILSLCSCKSKPEKTKGQTDAEIPGVSIESSDEKFEREFKNAGGKTVARIEMTYPVIKCDEAPYVAQIINNWFSNYRSDEIDFIEANLGNTEDYMTRFGIEGVTTTKITCEEYDRTESFVSYSISKKTGVNPDEDDGTTVGRSFSLADGRLLRLSDLYASDASDAEEKIKQEILNEADISYSVMGGIALTDEQHRIMNELFDEENICLTLSNVTFPYPFSTISNGARHGTYFCPVDYALLEGVIITPDEYYAKVLTPAQ